MADSAKRICLQRMVKARKFREPQPMLHMAGRNLIGASCKHCGIKLWAIEGGRLNVLPVYRNVTLYFEDGTSHATFACVQCAAEITGPEAAWHYGIDLWQTAKRDPVNFPWALMARPNLSVIDVKVEA